MEDIVVHCDKTIVKKEDSIKDTPNQFQNYHRKRRTPEHWTNHQKQCNQTSPTTKKVQNIQSFEIQTNFNNRGNTTNKLT